MLEERRQVEKERVRQSRLHDFLGLPNLILKAASIIAILVGCSVLLGWTLDVDVLKRILPGLVAMNPATAIAFILAGVSLLLMQPQNTASRLRRIAQGLAFAVALVGLIKFIGILVGCWHRPVALSGEIGVGSRRNRDLQPNGTQHRAELFLAWFSPVAPG